MILVTVGTNDFTIRHLFEEMDKIAPELGDDVIMQIAHSDFVGKNTTCVSFFKEREMQEIFDKTDLVVCLPGIGTILNSLKRNIPMVLFYDFKEFEKNKEIHAIANEIEGMGRGVIANRSNLKKKIEEARNLTFGQYKMNTELADYLDIVLSGYSLNNKIK